MLGSRLAPGRRTSGATSLEVERGWRQIRRTVGGGLWEETDGTAEIADGVGAATGANRMNTAGSVAAADALFSVATVLGAVSA